MKQTMSCEPFAQNIDAYLDSELSPIKRAAFIEHARTCPECGERLEFATRMMTMCAELDEGLSMPLEGQAAWRKAVRAEAAHMRPARLPAFVRGLSAVAAALLLLAGGTYAHKQMQPLSLGTAGIGENQPAIVENIMSAPGAASLAAAQMPMAKGVDSGLIRLTDGAADLAEFDMSVDDYDMDAPETDRAMGSIAPSSGFDPDVPESGIKEIRYASRDIETSAYDSDFQAVKDLVDEYQGRVEDESSSGAPIEPGQSHGRYAYLNLRIPTADLDAFLTALDAVGTINSRSESRQEITRQYYDASARLNSQKALRTELQTMIAQAQGVAELIEIKRELANVQSEIDSLEGEIASWDSQIAYSSVNISLSEVADKKAVQPIDSSSLMDRIKVGFTESINMLSAFAQDMLVFAAMFWPWILLALIVLIVTCTSISRRRRRRA